MTLTTSMGTATERRAKNFREGFGCKGMETEEGSRVNLINLALGY